MVQCTVHSKLRPYCLRHMNSRIRSNQMRLLRVLSIFARIYITDNTKCHIKLQEMVTYSISLFSLYTVHVCSNNASPSPLWSVLLHLVLGKEQVQSLRSGVQGMKRFYTSHGQGGLTLDVFLDKGQGFKVMFQRLPRCRSRVSRTSHQFRALAKTLKVVKGQEKERGLDQYSKVQEYRGDLAQRDMQ